MRTRNAVVFMLAGAFLAELAWKLAGRAYVRRLLNPVPRVHA